VAAMHQAQHRITAALHRNMRAFDELWQAGVSFDEIITVAFRMRRGEADAFKTIDFVNYFQQLNESRVAINGSDFTFSVTRNDLAQQRDFLYPLRDKLAAFTHDIRNGTAALLAEGIGNDAKGAILIAALHDTDEGGDRFRRRAVQKMFADG